MTDAEVRRPVSAWLWGGGLLIGSVVLPAGLGPGAIVGGELVMWLTRALFAAAMVVFAFGLRGEGSLVARRPVGVIALLVLAFAPPLIDVIVQQGANALLDGSGSFPQESVGLLQMLASVQAAVWAAAALVAAIEIARARVLPDPWRWAPTWGLAVVVGVYAISQIMGVAAGPVDTASLASIFAIGGFTAGILVPVGLGILVMMLGARGLIAPAAQIYPPVA